MNNEPKTKIQAQKERFEKERAAMQYPTETINDNTLAPLGAREQRIMLGIKDARFRIACQMMTHCIKTKIRPTKEYL